MKQPDMEIGLAANYVGHITNFRRDEADPSTATRIRLVFNIGFSLCKATVASPQQIKCQDSLKKRQSERLDKYRGESSFLLLILLAP